MEAENLPSKTQGNLSMQNITVQWNLKSALKNLPDEINPDHIQLFSKNIKDILQDFRRPAYSAIQKLIC